MSRFALVKRLGRVDQVVLREFDSLPEALKGLRRYIAALDECFCEWFDGRWIDIGDLPRK